MNEEIEELEQAEEWYEHYRYVADKGQGVIRVDKFLVDKIERVTRSKVQRAIATESVLVNDKVVKANYKIKPRDVISIVLPKPPNFNNLLAENIPLDIRYEDKDLMVVYKPPGLVVHPGVGNYSGTLVNGLVYYLQQEKHGDIPIMQGNLGDRPGLVHRIDKNTSGLLLIAKSEEAMAHLAKQFFNHTIKRRYVALVWGELEEDEGTITGHIGRHPRHRMEMTVFPDGEEGKHAITHYKVLERFYYVSLVECVLETGRTHQIRVHMKHMGCPLFNDERYGGDRIVKGTIFSKYKQFVQNCFDMIPRHALHAQSLGFVHPMTGEEMLFETELPTDLVEVIEKWRKYVNALKS
jgi:23S rRNA pseudouridine1911/1915/1917 synthase